MAQKKEKKKVKKQKFILPFRIAKEKKFNVQLCQQVSVGVNDDGIYNLLLKFFKHNTIEFSIITIITTQAARSVATDNFINRSV